MKARREVTEQDPIDIAISSRNVDVVYVATGFFLEQRVSRL